MKCHRMVLLAALATLFGGAPFIAAGSMDEACRVPPELARSRVKLEQVAAALKSGLAVKIVVYGTASSSATGVSRPEAAYPSRLGELLARAWGSDRVSVVNLSQSGQTAAQMAARIPSIIREQQPRLMVWQTGTVDALRGVDVNDFGDAIERGIRAADEANVDMIIMDAQYGSQATVLRDPSPYLDYLDQIVRGRDVILFHRHAMMKHWVDAGVLNLGEMPRAQQLRVADRVHDCLAQLLATMIRTAAQ